MGGVMTGGGGGAEGVRGVLAAEATALVPEFEAFARFDFPLRPVKTTAMMTASTSGTMADVSAMIIFLFRPKKVLVSSSVAKSSSV
jgi:hypothetical protein